MRHRSLFLSSCVTAISLPVIPLTAQEAKTPNVPAVKQEAEKPAAQVKAEKLIIPRISYNEADLGDCVAHLHRVSEKIDTELDPQLSGLNFLNRVEGNSKPVLVDLKDVSAWEAAQKIAVAAGVEVTATDEAVWFHRKGEAPVAPPMAEAWRESKEWQAAERITIDRVDFAGASLEEVCAHLRKQSAAAAGKEAKGLDIIAEGIEKEITMQAKNLQLSELLLAVAQMVRAKINVSEGTIMILPAAKVKE